MDSIPTQYSTIYVVCDTYENYSIKAAGRQLSDSGIRYVLKNVDLKVPYNIYDFLSVGENKENLFYLIKRGTEEEELVNRIVYF